MKPAARGAPAPMEGHGAYSRNASVQRASASPAVPILVQAAREAALPAAPQPIVIADYGASDGRNSLAPMRAAIAALRARAGAERPITVAHVDLPSNDFATLFQAVATPPEGYAAGDPAVFPTAIGRSFYEQALPAGSVALGWSSWALHWLSRVPAVIPDHLDVSRTGDGVARAAFAAQAAEDWRQFLLMRGRELGVGARLVVVTSATAESEAFGFGAVIDALHGGLMALVDEGLVTPAEAREMALPIVARTRAEWLAPFAATGDFAGLAIEQAEIAIGADRLWDAYERTGDAAALGAAWAAFSRASVFPTLAANLNGGGPAREAAFFTRLEAAMAARIAAHPRPVLTPVCHITLRRLAD